MENFQMPYVHLKAPQQKFNTEKSQKKENSCYSSVTTNNKRPRMNWTEELHQRLLDIIEKFGSEKSVPRNVLELMNVPGLTRKQIADHLHKYRCNSKRKLNQQQKKPRVTSPYVPLVVNNHGNQYYWLAVTENPAHRHQINENDQLQFSKNSLYGTMGSSSSNTLLAATMSTSSGLTSMEYGALCGSSSQLSLANNMSKENGYAKVTFGSQGGFLQVPEMTFQNFNNDIKEFTSAINPDNTHEFGWEGIQDTFEFGWEGIPDVFEGLDDLNAAGNYLYVEDASGLCDLFRSYIMQVRPHSQQFDYFDFGNLFTNDAVFQQGGCSRGATFHKVPILNGVYERDDRCSSAL